MLKLKVIRPSTSPWNFPIVIAPKKDGTMRFCINYRRLNTVTRKDKYPMPRIEDMIETVARKNYLSSFDMTTGYWQVSIMEEHKEQTTFLTQNGHWKWEHMPFRLTNVPATFQRLVELYLQSILWKFALAYLNDIIIFSWTFEKHIKHLQQLFDLLRKHHLVLKPAKCHLCVDELPYLGHLVTPKGLKPDLFKIKAIQGM